MKRGFSHPEFRRLSDRDQLLLITAAFDHFEHTGRIESRQDNWGRKSYRMRGLLEQMAWAARGPERT